MRDIAGEGQADNAIDDIERARAQVDSIVCYVKIRCQDLHCSITNFIWQIVSSCQAHIEQHLYYLLIEEAMHWR